MQNLPVRTRSRSPRYPNHSLSEAIEYVRKIYDGVHRSPVDVGSAFRLMGFSGRSGASATALGSVRQYGLIEGIGDSTRVSDLALKVLEPASAIELAAGIEEAATTPAIFSSIAARFNGKIPPADEPIRAFLIREMGFSKGGADECISALKETQNYVRSLTSESTRVAAGPDDHVDIQKDSTDSTAPGGKPSTGRMPDELIRLRLAKDCVVELRFEGDLDGKALTNLIRHIELMKDVLSED